GRVGEETRPGGGAGASAPGRGASESRGTPGSPAQPPLYRGAVAGKPRCPWPAPHPCQPGSRATAGRESTPCRGKPPRGQPPPPREPGRGAHLATENPRWSGTGSAAGAAGRLAPGARGSEPQRGVDAGPRGTVRPPGRPG